MTLTIAVDEDLGILISGSQEELFSFGETIVRAAEMGDAAGYILTEEGVMPVLVCCEGYVG